MKIRGPLLGPLQSPPPAPRNKVTMRLRPPDECVRASCGHESPRRHSFIQLDEHDRPVKHTIEALKENEAPILCPDCARKLKTQLTITDGFVDSPVPIERHERKAADKRPLKLVT